jgi:hypothetical protein
MPLGQVRHRRLLAQRLSAIFAFSAPSIFRLVLCLIVRSVEYGTAPSRIGSKDCHHDPHQLAQ